MVNGAESSKLRINTGLLSVHLDGDSSKLLLRLSLQAGTIICMGPSLDQARGFEALAQKSLDARLAEAALPWVAMKYAQPETWLVGNARKFNLQ